jgi:Ni/Fe-hydrogenase subunit HybB-like protein
VTSVSDLGFSKRLFAWTGLLSALVAAGLYGAYVVLTQGLIVTGMTDYVVWGLWIAAVFSFISLSAGAFAVSALIYVFHLEKFKAVGRLAVFIGLIGYTITMLTLVLDVGRPDRFWYPLVYWNNSSVLLEIFWCVSLYAAVLVGEFAPSVTEAGRLGRSRAVASVTKGLRWAMPALATAWVVFSTLHQSSLGALYGVLVARPLWNTELMPLVFLLSAIPAGLSMTLLVAMLTSRFMRREVASPSVLSDLGKLVGVSLLLYIVAYLLNYFMVSSSPASAGLVAAMAGTSYAHLPLLFELALGAIAPAIIFLVPRLRRSGKALFFGAALVIVGLVADRWDVTMMGQLASDSLPVTYVKGGDLPVYGVHLASYVPTWPEWVTVAGAVALGLLLFTLGLKWFRVLPVESRPAASAE